MSRRGTSNRPARTTLIGVLVALLVGALVASATGPATGEPRRPPVTRTIVSGIDVDRATIPELQRAMDRGRLSSVRLTRFYLQRIARLDGRLDAARVAEPGVPRECPKTSPPCPLRCPCPSRHRRPPARLRAPASGPVADERAAEPGR